jgi:hypothetical protein
MEGWSFLTGYPQLCEAETEASGRLRRQVSKCHQGARWRRIGRSLAWLPAVPGHGASLNGGY